ncbi:unnamed protein product [Closterium sp. Naga37s-1]|nr:unnamed protein product [Closterium sp. Naga37s-1]
MAELEEWIEKKVEAISALADAIRTEWESDAAPSPVGIKTGRKRVRVADGSSSDPMVMQQHLTALSAHAEAIREKVRGVGRYLRGGEQAQGGRMEGGGERGGNNEEQSGEEEKDDQNEKEEEEAGDGEKEAEAEVEGGGEVGMMDEEEEKTIDLVDETTEEGDEENLKGDSTGDASEEMEQAQPLVAGNGGGQDQRAGLGDEARDIMQGGGEGVLGRAGGEQSGAGEADGPVGNDLVLSVKRWAQEAGLCGAAAEAAAAAAAAGQPTQSKGAAGGEVQSALVGGKLRDEALKVRLQEEIHALLRLIPADKQVIQTRVINGMVCFLSSLSPKTQQSIPTVQRTVPKMQQLDGNPAAPQITSELQEITLSQRNLHYFLSLAPACRPTLLPSLTSLTLDHASPVSTRDMLSLVHLPSLTSLSFLQTPIAPSVLPLIQPFSHLHQLVLDCPGPSTLAFSSGPWPLKNLRVLHVSRVTNAVLEHVGMLRRLEVLSCTCCEGVGFMGWLCLVGLKRLRRLRVAPADLGDHGLRMDYPKGRLPVVSRVYARPQKKQGGVLWEKVGEGVEGGVHESARLNHLEGLPSQDDDSGVWHLLSSLPLLEHLELHAPPRYKHAFVSLDELCFLTTLHITGAALDNDDLKWLTRVTQLTHLSLAGCTFPTESEVQRWWDPPCSVVKRIADSMPKLVSLDLSGTAVTKEDIFELKYLKHLERLTLQQCCNLGQSFVRFLRFLPRLKELDLSFNNMLAAWLRHVVEGKRVRRLSVRGCGYKEKTVRGLERPWLVIEA